MTTTPSDGPDDHAPQTSDHTSRASSLARNVLSNWLAMALGVLSTFFVTPIVISALQKEQYGVWSFLNGLLAYSDLLYLGLGAALIKSVAALRAANNQSGLNRIASVVVSVYSVLGLVCLVVFGTLSVMVPHLLAEPMSPSTQTAAVTACWLLGVQLIFSFIGSGFSGVLFGLDRFDLINGVRIVAIVVRAVSIVLTIAGPAPMVTLAIITTLTTGFECLALAWLAFRVDRTLVIRPTKPTGQELRYLYGFGIQSFIVLFATSLIAYTDTTVIGVMLGASSVAIYVLPLQLIEYIRVAASGAAGVLLPRLTVLAETQAWDRLRSAYVTGTRGVMFLSTFMIANMMVLGSAFLRIWAGNEFGTQVEWVIVCLAMATWLHILSVVIPFGFYQAIGSLVVPAVALITEALVNLGLSVAFAPRFGILGVAIGTLIPAATVSCFVLPPYLWKRLGVAPMAALRGIAPSVVLLVVLVGTQVALGLVVADSSYLRLAARVGLTMPIALLVFALMFPEEERRWLRGELAKAVGLGRTDVQPS
jgi:O-antigen/teichoic acid export membrane protein